ncbi:Plasma membrane isoform 4 [Gossypium australe]|uniref:Plasma membrane isoform 4 n=1 Tax=Gossypium australe TaxID=47621 RepID=A0A5B6VHS1_9ROSI|nr:Plasma membrane isoform 4 [Gossypium australe]
MWLEIICGIIIYQLFRRFFYGGNDVLDVETSDFNAIFSVANRLEKLCGGKVYVGLNIPDADTGSRKSIDIVLVTKGEAAVISVKNVSGFVSINDDGSWTSEGGRSHRKERIPDPVAEAKNTASVLESYLEQRGVTLPEGYFSCKVIIPNPNFRLELKGSKHVLGEFLEFKGKQEDTLALRNIKRSKVGHMAVQKTSMLGLGKSP